MSGDALREVRVWRFGAPGKPLDAVAREEPLEIQVGGVSLAVVMRTPGHDEDLVSGFLVTERVIDAAEQVTSLRHCRQARTPEAADNVMQVQLRGDVKVDWEALRRNLYASSSCGVCGKATIENALQTAPPLQDEARFPAAIFAGLVDQLRASQAVFERTGGLHGAGLFDADGRVHGVREDVGRHNAVDKVIGARLRGTPEATRVAAPGLLVSGRISFEIVQKALAARLPLVAGVSAPTSLAIELAEASGMTLVAFLRDARFNVYGARERIVAA